MSNLRCDMVFFLIWNSKLILNLFWSIQPVFVSSPFCVFWPVIIEMPAVMVWVITGIWAGSDYPKAMEGEKSGQRASILSTFRTHTYPHTYHDNPGTDQGQKHYHHSSNTYTYTCKNISSSPQKLNFKTFWFFSLQFS